jgi:hypothetical protein
MDFPIEPYVGVGPIRFGMSVSEVRSVLGGEVRTFRKGRFARGDTDAFLGWGIHVHYSATGICEAVEIGYTTIPTFEGRPLLGRPFREVYELLRSYDPSLQLDDTGLTSYLLGIGIYMSSMKEEEDWDADVQGVIVFTKGYYD